MTFSILFDHYFSFPLVDFFSFLVFLFFPWSLPDGCLLSSCKTQHIHWYMWSVSFIFPAGRVVIIIILFYLNKHTFTFLTRYYCLKNAATAINFLLRTPIILVVEQMCGLILWVLQNFFVRQDFTVQQLSRRPLVKKGIYFSPKKVVHLHFSCKFRQRNAEYILLHFAHLFAHIHKLMPIPFTHLQLIYVFFPDITAELVQQNKQVSLSLE